MNKRAPTSTDVAKLAGVSRTTVSMILNNSTAGSFPEETRERVLEAATRLGYSPNSAARMLVRGDTETIGLVISDPDLMLVDGFVPQLLVGVSQAAGEAGYRVLLEALDPERPSGYPDLVAGRRIDGLVVLNPRIRDAGIQKLIEREYPVVLLGSTGHPREYAVNFSNSKPVRALIEHLVGLGHRRIAHIALSCRGDVATNARLTAYRRALTENGLEFDETLVVHAAFSAESGRRAMEELLERRVDATAVFAGNDTLALGAVAALSERGLRVPDDMAVVGFDDLPFAAHTVPPLTTVRNPGVEQGRLAAEKLIHLMRREETERRTVVDTQVVIRRSCGARL